MWTLEGGKWESFREKQLRQSAFQGRYVWVFPHNSPAWPMYKLTETDVL